MTIRWVLARSGISGNEKADEFARVATNRAAQCSDGDVLDELRREASIYAVHETSWPEGTTSSFLAMQRSGRIFGTGYIRSTQTGAGLVWFVISYILRAIPKLRFHLVARCPDWARQARVM